MSRSGSAASVSSFTGVVAEAGIAGGGIAVFATEASDICAGSASDVVAGIGGVVFFCPALAAASTPACLIAIDKGESFLSWADAVASLSFLFWSVGSLIDMCLVSLAVRPAPVCADLRASAAAWASAAVADMGTSPKMSIWSSICSSSSPYSFHSSTCSRS